MCGIAGIITPRARPEDCRANALMAQDPLQEMQHLLTSMKHRGPDAMDMRQCSENVLLGSNRLRITDAANIAADMPLVSDDKRLTIVFNGEIYNHEALRAEILAARPDHAFRTRSDTETVMAAFELWGPSCVARFEGMYAFAIHDADRNQTTLAADPTGQKTIYVHQGPQGIAFASEIDALISDTARPKHWDNVALQEFISQRFIIGAQTHIAEITKVLPGTLLIVSKTGACEQSRFYHVPIGDQQRSEAGQVAHEIEHAVRQGVERTAHLEVPHALLLSGGIDSTSVLSCLRQQGVKPNTYSTGFTHEEIQPDQDAQSQTQNAAAQDYEFAEQLANTYHTPHETHLLPISEYCDYLDKWTEYCGEPLGSQEAPCLIKLLEGVSQGGAKVVYTGSGPDELFDGYSYGLKMAAVTDLEHLPATYADTFHWADAVDLDALMPNSAWRENVIQKYEDILSDYKAYPLNVLQAVQLLHFHGRLAAYECRQMDVISMRHSIEGRAPLLDLDLIKVAFDFDPALKQQGSEKGIFKTGVGSIVPQSIMTRKKGAFPIPQDIWFSKDFAQRARILFDKDAQIVKTGLVDKDYLEKIWSAPTIGHRNIFSRLYTLEKIMRRQAPFISSTS